MRTDAIRRGRRLLVLVIGIAIAFGCNTESESGSSTAGRDSDILVARSVDAGITWSAPAALNVDATSGLGADEAPQLTTDGLGAWLAVWHATSFAEPIRTDFDVLVSHSANGGARWSDHLGWCSHKRTSVRRHQSSIPGCSCLPLDDTERMGTP